MQEDIREPAGSRYPRRSSARLRSRPLARLVLPVVLLVAAAVRPPATVRAEATLARLADDAAAALARAARGAPIEMAMPEDRTGRGSGLALDLQSLILARLPRAAAGTPGTRAVRVTSVLSESPGRLVFSARLVEEPGGRLLDLVSVSMATDAGDLSLASVPWPGASDRLDVVRQARTPTLPAPVLDLAFLDDSRLVVLWAEELGLYRWEDGGLRLESRQPLRGPRVPVRAPGGLLAVAEKEQAFWAMTSRVARPALFGVDGTRVVERSSADAVPWPGSRSGLRFRAGTNLLEGQVDGLGAGPFLAVNADEGALAVTGEGRMVGLGDGDQRVGASLAVPRAGVVLTSTALPPPEADALVALERKPPFATLARLPVDGSIRAIAARAAGPRSRIVAAVEREDGTHLLAVEVGWR